MSGIARITIYTFLVSFVYGLFASGVYSMYSNSRYIMLVLVIGFTLILSLTLQRFGGKSIKAGLILSCISILGAVLGWLTVSNMAH